MATPAWIGKMQTEKNLTKELQLGSELAFTCLYDLYSKQLYRNIFRLVKDEDVAQELLQDLFLKIWEKRADIDPDKSFKSFLYKVAENLVYMHFRRLSKDKRLAENLLNSYFEFDMNAEEALILQEKMRFLENAIGSHIGDYDEWDHTISAQADPLFRGKLTMVFRGKLTHQNE